MSVLVNSSINGSYRCGSLVGYNGGIVQACFNVGSTDGYNNAGGLIGENSGSDWGCCEPESGSKGYVYNSWSIGPVNGEWDVGSFIGDNNGNVQNCLAYCSIPYQGYGGIDLIGDNDEWRAEVYGCYYPSESCSLGQEEGIVRKSAADLQHQSTYENWDFANIWAIQEGRGTAYIAQFAEGRDQHLTIVPEVTSPGNQNPVETILPEFSGNVDTSSGDFVNAIWQISTSYDFSGAKTWMGCASNCYENAILNSSFTSKLPPMHALEYNNVYFVRVTLQTSYGAWTDWSAPNMFALRKPNDPMATGKQNLEVALGAVALNGVLLGDNLHEAAGDFASAVSRDPNDYEARIFSSVTKVLELADNSEFRNLIAEFGYTFGDSLCGGYTGALDMASAPLPNECVDRIAAQCEPVLESALVDLEAIPTNWPGSVTLRSEEFDIDETVEIDRGDVLFLRSMLNASQAFLSFAQAYDVTIEYANTNIFLPDITAPVAAITLDGDIEDWADVPEAVKSDDYQLETVKIAYSNDMAYLLFKMAEDTPLNRLWGRLNLRMECIHKMHFSTRIITMNVAKSQRTFR